MKSNSSNCCVKNYVKELAQQEQVRVASIDRLIGDFFDIVGLEDLSNEIIESTIIPKS